MSSSFEDRRMMTDATRIDDLGRGRSSSDGVSVRPRDALPFAAGKLASKLRQALTPKRVKYRFNDYDDVIVGSEVVDWIGSRSWCNDREQATLCATYLVQEGLLYHVTHSYEVMKDGYFFYRYNRAHDVSIPFEDSLYKLSSDWSKWNRRWFVLKGSKLSYWAAGQSRSASTTPKATYELYNATVTRGLSLADHVAASTAPPRNFVLTIKLDGKKRADGSRRILAIAAGSVKTMTMWESALEDASECRGSGNEDEDDDDDIGIDAPSTAHNTPRRQSRHRLDTSKRRPYSATPTRASDLRDTLVVSPSRSRLSYARRGKSTPRFVRSHRLLSPKMRSSFQRLLFAIGDDGNDARSDESKHRRGIEQTIAHVISSGPSDERAFIEGFCNWRLESYEKAFGKGTFNATRSPQKKYSSSSPFARELMQRRFAWFHEFCDMTSQPPYSELWPTTWRSDARIETCMAKMFCCVTREHIAEMLLMSDQTVHVTRTPGASSKTKKSGAAAAAEDDDDSKKPLQLTLDKIRALMLTIQFEKGLHKRFGEKQSLLDGGVSYEGAISQAFDGQMGSYVNKEMIAIRNDLVGASGESEVTVTLDAKGRWCVFRSLTLIFAGMKKCLSRVEKLKHPPTLMLLQIKFESLLRKYALLMRRRLRRIEVLIPMYEISGLRELAAEKRRRTGLGSKRISRSSYRNVWSSPKSPINSPPRSSDSGLKRRHTATLRDEKAAALPPTTKERLCALLNTLQHLFATMPVLQDRIHSGVDAVSNGDENDEDSVSPDAGFADETVGKANLWRLIQDHSKDAEKGLTYLAFLTYAEISAKLEESFGKTCSRWGRSGEDDDVHAVDLSPWITILRDHLERVVPLLRDRLDPKCFRRFCLRFASTFVSRLWALYFRLDSIEGMGAMAAQRDFKELSRVLVEFPFHESDGGDSSTSSSATLSSSPRSSKLRSTNKAFFEASLRKYVEREMRHLKVAFKVVYFARKGSGGSRHLTSDYGKKIVQFFGTLWPEGKAEDLNAILTLKGLARGEVSDMFGPIAKSLTAGVYKRRALATFRHDPHCFECCQPQWTMRKHHCRSCGHTFCSYCITQKVPFRTGKESKSHAEWICNSCLMHYFQKLLSEKRGLKLDAKTLVAFQDDITATTSEHVTTVSAGKSHSLFLRIDGKVLRCGRPHTRTSDDDDDDDDNDDDGDDESLSMELVMRLSRYEQGVRMEKEIARASAGLVPTILSFPSSVHIRQISAGESHSLFLADSGVVFSCGSGEDGQLGHGSVCDVESPKRIDALSGARVVQIVAATGSTRSLFLECNGEVWSCGRGGSGALGYGHQIERATTPKKMQLLSGARCVQLDGGAEYTALLTDKGSVMVTGTLLRDTTPLVATRPVVLGDTAGGGVRRVVCGGYHILLEAIDDDLKAEDDESSQSFEKRRGSSVDATTTTPANGRARRHGAGYERFRKDAIGAVVLYSFGRGDRGALGHGDLLSLDSPKVVAESRAYGVKYSSAGMHHTLVVSTSGWVFVCGDNRDGRLGLGADRRRVVSTLSLVRSLLSAQSHSRRERGGRGEEDAPIVQSSSGGSHSLLVDQSGCVFVCGQNTYGQLGVGDLKRRNLSKPTCLEVATSHMDRKDLELRVQQAARAMVRRKFEAFESRKAAADASLEAKRAVIASGRAIKEMGNQLKRFSVACVSEADDTGVPQRVLRGPRLHERRGGENSNCACVGCVVM
eukprot:g3444.t1